MKLEFSRHNFENNIKFRSNPSSGRRGFPCGPTNRQTSGSYQLLFAILRTSLKTLKLRNWVTLNQKIIRIKIRIFNKKLSAYLTQDFYTFLAIVPVGKRTRHYRIIFGNPLLHTLSNTAKPSSWKLTFTSPGDETLPSLCNQVPARKLQSRILKFYIEDFCKKFSRSFYCWTHRSTTNLSLPSTIHWPSPPTL
jgi:hypothetical protein